MFLLKVISLLTAVKAIFTVTHFVIWCHSLAGVTETMETWLLVLPFEQVL